MRLLQGEGGNLRRPHHGQDPDHRITYRFREAAAKPQDLHTSEPQRNRQVANKREPWRVLGGLGVRSNSEGCPAQDPQHDQCLRAQPRMLCHRYIGFSCRCRIPMPFILENRYGGASGLSRPGTSPRTLHAARQSRPEDINYTHASVCAHRSISCATV